MVLRAKHGRHCELSRLLVVSANKQCVIGLLLSGRVHIVWELVLLLDV